MVEVKPDDAEVLHLIALDIVGKCWGSGEKVPALTPL